MAHGVESTTTRPEIRPGMVVYTAEGEHFGVVEKHDDDGITIETGRYFRRPVTIAYDEIADMDGKRVILRPDPPAAPKPQPRVLGPLPVRGAAPERMLPAVTGAAIPSAPAAAKETAAETAPQPRLQRYRTEELFLSTLLLGLLLGFAAGVLYEWRRTPRRRSVYRRFFT